MQIGENYKVGKDFRVCLFCIKTPYRAVVLYRAVLLWED